MNTVTSMNWITFDDDDDEVIGGLIERIDELETRVERLEIIHELEDAANEDDDIKTQFQVMKELVKTLMDKTDILQQMVEQMAQSKDATDEAESESEDSDYVSDVETSEEPLDGPMILTNDANGNAVWSKRKDDNPIGLSMYPADGGKQIVITLKGFGLK